MTNGRPTTSNSDEDRKNVKWGMFYYDPDDKHFFHSKKNADMGVTINFAHPSAKYFVAFFLIIILGVLFLILFAAFHK